MLVLAATGLFGVYGAFDEWPGAQTYLQKSVTAGEAVYGILGIIAVIRLIQRKTSSVRFAGMWAIVATYVATAAVIAYGHPARNDAVSAALQTFAACSIFTAIIVWLTAIGSRQIISYDEGN